MRYAATTNLYDELAMRRIAWSVAEEVAGRTRIWRRIVATIFLLAVAYVVLEVPDYLLDLTMETST